jgi:hypothetical protein
MLGLPYNYKIYLIHAYSLIDEKQKCKSNIQKNNTSLPKPSDINK